MITIEQLQSVGFIDESPDKNGMGYRLRLKSYIMELVVYIPERKLRLQTIHSGVTIALKGVESMGDLARFYYYVTGEILNEAIVKSSDEGTKRN
jgi:hypothetical protein